MYKDQINRFIANTIVTISKKVVNICLEKAAWQKRSCSQLEK